MPIDVRRGLERTDSRGELVASRHSFSFGPHYDPSNVRFGTLVAHNDDLLEPGGGFAEHPHRDLEIVTWVIEGAVEHRDSGGGHGVVRPGTVACLSAGDGVRHSEVNVSSGPTRSLQMWLIPDAEGPASYQTATGAFADDSLCCVAAGDDAGVTGWVRLRCAGAALFVARLTANASAEVSASALVHVFVAVGRVVLTTSTGERVDLAAGDALRATSAGSIAVVAAERAEVLVWAMAGTA